MSFSHSGGGGGRVVDERMNRRRHGGAVLSTVAALQEGCRFDSWIAGQLCVELAEQLIGETHTERLTTDKWEVSALKYPPIKTFLL